MKYVVMVKQVPDTSSVTVAEDGSLVRAGVPSILDPYCERALRHILDLKRAGDTVIAVTMGPGQASEALRRCVSLGADEAYLLTDRDFAGADTWATARVLVAFITKFACDADLYVFGRQTIDGDTGQVPAEVAGLLDVRQFCYATSLSVGEDGFTAVQDYGGFVRTSEVPKGSVVAFGDVDPCGCIPSVEGFMRGLDAEVVEIGRVQLGLGLYSVGKRGSVTKIAETRTIKDGRRNMKVEISSPSSAADFILKEAKGLR